MDIEIKGTILLSELDKWDVEELSEEEREKAEKEQLKHLIDKIFPIGSIVPFRDGITKEELSSPKMKWEHFFGNYWKRIE